VLANEALRLESQEANKAVRAAEEVVTHGEVARTALHRAGGLRTSATALRSVARARRLNVLRAQVTIAHEAIKMAEQENDSGWVHHEGEMKTLRAALEKVTQAEADLIGEEGEVANREQVDEAAANEHSATLDLELVVSRRRLRNAQGRVTLLACKAQVVSAKQKASRAQLAVQRAETVEQAFAEESTHAAAAIFSTHGAAAAAADTEARDMHLAELHSALSETMHAAVVADADVAHLEGKLEIAAADERAEDADGAETEAEASQAYTEKAVLAHGSALRAQRALRRNAQLKKSAAEELHAHERLKLLGLSSSRMERRLRAGGYAARQKALASVRQEVDAGELTDARATALATARGAEAAQTTVEAARAAAHARGEAVATSLRVLQRVVSALHAAAAHAAQVGDAHAQHAAEAAEAAQAAHTRAELAAETGTGSIAVARVAQERAADLAAARAAAVAQAARRAAEAAADTESEAEVDALRLEAQEEEAEAASRSRVAAAVIAAAAAATRAEEATAGVCEAVLAAAKRQIAVCENKVLHLRGNQPGASAAERRQSMDAAVTDKSDVAKKNTVLGLARQELAWALEEANEALEEAKAAEVVACAALEAELKRLAVARAARKEADHAAAEEAAEAARERAMAHRRAAAAGLLAGARRGLESLRRELAAAEAAVERCVGAEAFALRRECNALRERIQEAEREEAEAEASCDAGAILQFLEGDGKALPVGTGRDALAEAEAAEAAHHEETPALRRMLGWLEQAEQWKLEGETRLAHGYEPQPAKGKTAWRKRQATEEDVLQTNLGLQGGGRKPKKGTDGRKRVPPLPQARRAPAGTAGRGPAGRWAQKGDGVRRKAPPKMRQSESR